MEHKNPRIVQEKINKINKKALFFNILSRIGITIGLLVAASLVGVILRNRGLEKTDIAIVYLLAVLLTACYTDGYIFGIISSILAAFSFSFLFTEPLYSFKVDTDNYVITMTVMTITALVSSTITTHGQQNSRKAMEREAETKALYTLTNRLTDAIDLHEIVGIAITTMSELLQCNVGLLSFDYSGKPEQQYLQLDADQNRIYRKVEEMDYISKAMKNQGNEPFMDSHFCNWPIRGEENILGLIRVPREVADEIKGTQARMLTAMIGCIALAMDRFFATQQRIRSREEITQERYRSNLLRAISHDLRTPLAGLIGTTEMVLNMTEKKDQKYTLLLDIHKESNWLHSLVENILSLTKLQDGKLLPNKQEEAVEEVVGVAIRHVTRYFPEYNISVEVPDELLIVPMDGTLIGQVLINLMENAVKHTNPEDHIHVAVEKNNRTNEAVFTVSDEGTGISEEDLPHIFQMFYTSKTKSVDSQLGIGLGLTICDVVVKAHGGTISCRNREEGGVEFTFTLPLED